MGWKYSDVFAELEIITLHVDKVLDLVPMVSQQRSLMEDIKRRAATARELLEREAA